MSEGEPLFSGLEHIGILTADLDRTTRAWTERYGIEPWDVSVWDGSSLVANIRGESVEFAMRVAHGGIGSLRIELAQPLDERGPFAQSLARHGGADHVHHLRLRPVDYDAALSELADRQVPTLVSVRTDRDGVETEATYLDTEIGVAIELGVVRQRTD